MATRTTGRAASIARNQERKKKQVSTGVSTAAPTSAPLGTGGSARGDDFSTNFTGSEAGRTTASTPVSTTPRPKSELKSATFGLAGGGGGSSTSATQARLQQEKARKDALKRNADRRKRQSKNGFLASDNMRASEINTTQDEAVTTKGTSSVKGLSDKEIDGLAARGYFEGDFVPGKGVLLPDGTFDTKKMDSIVSQAEALKQKFDEFKAKEASAAAGATSSDAAPVKEEKDATTSVADALKDNPMSRTLALLDEQIAILRQTQREEEASINASYKDSKGALQGKQAGEIGTQSVELANAGGYLGYSGSAQGVMLNLAESHRSEIAALDVKRQQAISEARRAAANREFDVVKEKARVIAGIEQAAYEAELDYNEKVQLEADKKKAIEEKLQTEKDIFAAVQAGAKTPKAIFEQLGGVVDAKTITDFLTNITKNVGDENSMKFSAAQNTMLLGSGMSRDDIMALNEYVNEYGYNETARSMLTPAQKVAADKIFKTGAVGTGTSTGFTSQEKRKLEQAGLLEAPRQEQLDYLYGDKDDSKPFKSVYTGQILEGSTTLEALPYDLQEDVRNELYALGYGSSVVPQWYQDYVQAEESRSITEDALEESWETYRKTALGEATEDEESDSWWSGFITK